MQGATPSRQLMQVAPWAFCTTENAGLAEALHSLRERLVRRLLWHGSDLGDRSAVIGNHHRLAVLADRRRISENLDFASYVE